MSLVKVDVIAHSGGGYVPRLKLGNQTLVGLKPYKHEKTAAKNAQKLIEILEILDEGDVHSEVG